MALIGAPALHRRLKALQDVPKRMQRHWAERATPLIRSDVPVRRGVSRASVRPTSRGVYGNLSVMFLDRGTKAHEEPWSGLTKTGRVSRSKRAQARTGKTLKFNVGGRTLFRKKVQKPQQRGRHFIRPDTEKALKQSGLTDIVKEWNEAA